MVVVIPCPYEAVANLHFPHLKVTGIPTSSISKSIAFIKLNLFINFLNFSSPTAWPILTEPILPDLISICSAVKLDGIFLSYSLIIFLPH